ncbi:hypothetical protein CH513_15465 [Salmonella enterica subsp. enterica serovar Infantis]|nr:hypothetical protein [Salmonella enterica subsp. enterica serovar Infantis]
MEYEFFADYVNLLKATHAKEVKELKQEIVYLLSLANQASYEYCEKARREDFESAFADLKAEFPEFFKDQKSDKKRSSVLEVSESALTPIQIHQGLDTYNLIKE